MLEFFFNELDQFVQDFYHIDLTDFLRRVNHFVYNYISDDIIDITIGPSSFTISDYGLFLKGDRAPIPLKPENLSSILRETLELYGLSTRHVKIYQSLEEVVNHFDLSMVDFFLKKPQIKYYGTYPSDGIIFYLFNVRISSYLTGIRVERDVIYELSTPFIPSVESVIGDRENISIYQLKQLILLSLEHDTNTKNWVGRIREFDLIKDSFELLRSDQSPEDPGLPGVVFGILYDQDTASFPSIRPNR